MVIKIDAKYNFYTRRQKNANLWPLRDKCVAVYGEQFITEKDKDETKLFVYYCTTFIKSKIHDVIVIFSWLCFMLRPKKFKISNIRGAVF